jgi:hypothetical protein
MNIEERVKATLSQKEDREKDPQFQNLREFYEAKKKEGVVVKQEYKLPPLDTIGRNLFESTRFGRIR